MNDAARPPSAGYGLGTEEIKRRHIVVKALLVGAMAGLFSSLFRISLRWSEAHRIALMEKMTGLGGLAVSLGLGALGGGLGVWLVRRFALETAGSGIPHLKSVVRNESSLRWRRVLPVKFISGLASIAGGFTLGREGPTIQIGGASGLMISEWSRVKQGEGERRALISAGSGAGLAAAFNAPLAGMIFVLEELRVNLTPVVFVAAFLASVMADVVCRLLTGVTPEFSLLHGVVAPTFSVLPGALVIGLLAGLTGVFFNRALLTTLDLYDRLHKWPAVWIGAATGIVIGLIGWIAPVLVGTGGPIIDQALTGKLAIGTVLIFLVARFGLTMASYGSGPAGGIFLPTFVLGALGGLIFGTLAHAVLPGWFPQPQVFVILGMGALFTAVVRAPLTGLVMMIELTGVYDFMLPLLASCLVAYGIAEALNTPPIYDALRLRNRHNYPPYKPESAGLPTFAEKRDQPEGGSA